MSKNLLRKLLLGLWLLLGGGTSAQAILRKDLKKDFEAVGDGRTNDQAAFARAAEFFNQRAKTPAGTAYAELYIPKGTYLIAQPGAAPMPDLLHLIGCRNLVIIGDDSANTEIRYADGLRYGAFDPATKLPYEAASAYFVDGQYAAALGTAIVLQGCDNVSVSGLSLNGNSPHLAVGGHWGDTGIQLGADGIFVSGSRRIRLRRLAVHHFGRDGIQVLNHFAKDIDDAAREDILLESCRFEYNGRQGLSVTGANGLRAVRCSFSHTGRVLIPATGRPLYSNPGAGVDIEPEGGYVANVRLESCRLVNNAGQGLVSDRYGNGPPTTKNIVLNDCLLWGLTNWSAWVRQTDFRFENCRLYGAFITGCAVASYATQFVGCTFEDRPYHGQPAYGQHLLYSNQEARAMHFTNCHFVGTRNYLLFARPAAPDTASRFQFRSCTFELEYRELPLGSMEQLSGVVFSGNTVFGGNKPLAEEAPDIGSPPRDIVLGNGEALASAVVQARSSLHLLAPHCRYVLPAGLAIGRAANVLVGAGSELVLREQAAKQPELYIGPNAQVVVQRGSMLEMQPHTKVTIAGRLVIEDGAFFFADATAVVATVGRGRLRLAPKAIKGRRPE